ncbi:MAG: iron chelate uptake ABC transporter family permease subunit, partial [Burkholderiaceae bacterium]
MALLCMTIGPYNLSATEVIQTVLQGQATGTVSTAHLVVWEIRLPRVLAAVIFGIARAMSG